MSLQTEDALKIQIYRGLCNLRYERWVTIRSNTRIMGKRQTKHFRIDPQEELIRATGYSYDRRSCILSFADGLQSAGHEVFIKHLSLPEVAHINPYPTMLVYHLLGLIVGNNGNMPSLEPWYQFCRTMTRVPHRLRPDVLHFTAEYSFDRPQGPIEPLAPIGLLL